MHVNLSDIAAMGAEPKWATVALTLPAVEEKWLAKFSECLHRLCQENTLNLVGGDTTQGPLSVTLNMTGIVKRGEFITRDGAQIGDDIYVSGSLGDAALALDSQADSDQYQQFIDRLKRPTARLFLGERLFGIATSCIDVSDGLMADLSHICKASQCGAQLFVEKLPLSITYRNYFSSGNLDRDYALNGGDDYELCFTANKSKNNEIQKLINVSSCNISLIGKMVMTEKNDVIPLLNGELYQCQLQGWQHFAE